jgi:glycosyltransferase involved in cell wall biosynthesis
VQVLLKAWEVLGKRVRLRIAGGGPLADYVRKQQAVMPNIEYLGFQARSEVNRLMQDARALVLPSLSYEGIPRTVLESFATGTPVIASKLGAMESVIQHQRTGLHFIPGDATDLVRQVERILDCPDELAKMRQLARAEYETKYTAEHNYEMLMQIYGTVLRDRPHLSTARNQGPSAQSYGTGR